MEVIQPNLDFLYKTGNLRYQAAVEQTPTWNQELATTFPSSTRQEIYAWIDRFPNLRIWTGNRQLNGVSTHSQVVTNIPFELTVNLSVRDVRDNNLNMFGPAVDMMGQKAKKWPDVTLFSYLKIANTAAANGYDGQPQFSTSHPISGGDVANGITGNQSNLNVSTALTYDNYAASRAKMRALVGADGQPLTVNPNLLVVGPALEATGKLILESEFLPNTAGTAPQSNVLRNSAKLLVLPEMAALPNAWILADTTQVVKPFGWQQRLAPQFTFLNRPTDWNVFFRNDFIYGIEAEGAAFGTLWFYSQYNTSASTYLG